MFTQLLKLIYIVPVCLLGATGVYTSSNNFDVTDLSSNPYHNRFNSNIAEWTTKAHIASDSLKSKKINPPKTNKPLTLNITVKNPKEAYVPGQKHTLALELQLAEGEINNFNLEPILPKDWKLISSSKIEKLDSRNSKLVLVSFFIPRNTPPGTVTIQLKLTEVTGNRSLSKDFSIQIAENYDLEVFLISGPQNVKAGERVVSKFGVRNIGNMAQQVALSSNAKIEGETMLTLEPSITQTVEVTRNTDAKHYYVMTLGSYLQVTNSKKETLKSFSNTTVFPSKIEQKDAFFRFPIRASFNYNSYTSPNTHFSTISGELSGDGFLDLNKKHHLNFILRAPQQQTLKRFGVTDQYSLIYNYDDKTTIYLGDHAYFINRLGFDNRFGLGFRVDQRVKNWTFTAFYSNPRLFTFNDSPLYGTQVKYAFNSKLQMGLSLTSSNGTIRGASNKIEANENEKGQIATLSLDYKSENTFIESEFSGSFTNLYSDYAGYLNLIQTYKNLTYSGTLTITGENYFGSIRNSLQYSNNLFYKFNKWNVSAGNTVSRVNQRLDPLFYAAEPYFENTFILLGYRFNQKHSVDVRADQRQREDQLEPKSYFYKEKGITYRYLFSGGRFNFNFNGRVSKTRNLLSNFDGYRDSYAHNANASYMLFSGLSLRVGLNHNYNNRYGNSGLSTSYTRYNLGVNYNLNKVINFNGSYNSGFSPDDSYLRRDFINANLAVRVSKNHLFEIRANYFENAGAINNRELLAFGKYTYSFGAPLKRTMEQGGVDGFIFSEDDTISVENIKIITTGQRIASDEQGEFRLNNLPLGKNYVFIDDSSLPENIVSTRKAPFEVNVTSDNTADLSIELVKAAVVTGKINLISKKDTIGYKGYVKLSGADYNYFIETDASGSFTFKNIVPATYTLTLIRFKEENDYEKMSDYKITASSGKQEDIHVYLTAKEQKIKFNTTNFIISN
ncbi:hypothetical protein [Leeuwenhoekiella sp. MAR_2009_132]|uniref:hypothetical protein n=1 Tax=Leeuwenhoekiella sp. MAR_2009_132 TaxID=1392489 RepID=UPI00048C9279|nr:hypothetical protein [Leeuwenhoekiella sp. MAR_2009_132]